MRRTWQATNLIVLCTLGVAGVSSCRTGEQSRGATAPELPSDASDCISATASVCPEGKSAHRTTNPAGYLVPSGGRRAAGCLRPKETASTELARQPPTARRLGLFQIPSGLRRRHVIPLSIGRSRRSCYYQMSGCSA